MPSDPEIWVHPATHGAEPVPAWRDALVVRVVSLLALAALVYGIVLLLIHVQLAGA